MDTKKLRQKILDLAIRGKLVPQDPNDEPASVLLERIREEKKQMVKDGKLKAKDIKNDTIIYKGEDNLHYEKFQDGTVKCIEDEIPFEVPEGWAWCRIKNICNMSAGKSKSADKIHDEPFENSYPCFGGNGIRGYVDEYNNDGTYSIVGRQGALCGNINIATGKFYATEHAVVTYLYSQIDFKWSNYCLEALELNRFATGAAQPGLSVANVLNVLVPLPPYAEQCIIGEKVDCTIMLSEVIEKEKDELTDIISSTKNKILDLAIRGKLVHQDANDEPASVLLERIRAEKEELIKQGKLKRDKKESVIFKGDDNSYYQSGKSKPIKLPFDIPATWTWSNLQELCNYGECDNVPPQKIPSDAWILDLEDIEKDSGKILQRLTNSERQTNSTKHSFKKNMVLYSKLRPYLNKVVLADNDGYCTSEIIPLNFKDIIYPQYARLFLMSNHFVSYANECSYGMKMPRLGTKDGQDALFALPPYSEQIRIADMADRLSNYLETIAESLE